MKNIGTVTIRKIRDAYSRQGNTTGVRIFLTDTEKFWTPYSVPESVLYKKLPRHKYIPGCTCMYCEGHLHDLLRGKKIFG